jgi:D-alanine-D-alanine ligase
MRIAFTHNLQSTGSEHEAEFDTPETVTAVIDALEACGHDVYPVEVSGSVSTLIARLERLSPDLVFNTAEGERGRGREGFYPALFEQLELPYTGSDAYVCTVTLDKQLSKQIVARYGVPTPKWTFADADHPLDVTGMRFPMICKPNFEGSSKGITLDSIVEDRAALDARVAELLARYPSGILIEEYIVGRDIVAPFIEGVSPGTGGVLEPASYHYHDALAHRRYQIYDFDLKTRGFAGLEVRVPAAITAAERDRALVLSRLAFRALGIRDLGRIDWRLGDDGDLYFIEVNALPSLEDGASIYLSGALAGLEGKEGVLAAIVRSAASRHRIDDTYHTLEHAHSARLV